MDATVRYDLSKLKGFSSYLKQTIFGQDAAIESVVDMMTINFAGLGDKNKPIASFLFTGPTGVGKTQLAIEIAKYLDMHFERFDMSEYADETSYRNLIGGHKGLVGYEDGGLLTNAINEHPVSVLLLDEIEKADKAVYNTFLQVFDYATLKDTKGNVTDFSNTIIIMTSNLESVEKRGIGFGEHKNTYKESAVSSFLTPEFRNRIDKILHFNTLTKDMIAPVVDKFLDELKESLLENDVVMSVSPKATEYLVAMGFDSLMGARSVKRTIGNVFKRHIAKEMLFGSLIGGGEVHIDIDKDGFVYRDGVDEDTPSQAEASDGTLLERYGYDFETADEAMAYAKNNPGICISRSPLGIGYIIK